MDGIENTEIKDQTNQTEVDPWAAAFAALNKAEQETIENTENSGTVDDNAGNNTAGVENSDASQGDDRQHTDASVTPDGNDSQDADNIGGLDNPAGEDSVKAGDISGDMLGVSDDEIQSIKDGYAKEARDRAIDEVAQAFIKRGIRNKNGRLGATIKDEDIMQRDEDGVPHFYNPDTKREFSGDNPRKQAQEWVDQYNAELGQAFNQACEQYEQHILGESAPQLAVLEFAPQYDKLDPIRKYMFDEAIEDYAILDSDGNISGYSCDLNKALAMVNRQVERIQAYGKTQTPEEPKTGPALDMKNSSATANKPGERPEFKSLSEAMEWQQNKILEEQKKGN